VQEALFWVLVMNNEKACGSLDEACRAQMPVKAHTDCRCVLRELERFYIKKGSKRHF
jgi:hypothetical protein